MKFSVIIPVFNAENTLATAINSVINQSFTDWELLIVDDCSTDGTHQIAENFANNDIRIKLLKLQHNSGSAKMPRDTGIKNAQGEYIVFLDSDDELTADYLKTMYEHIFQYKADVVLPVLLKKEYGQDAVISQIPCSGDSFEKVLSGTDACRLTIPGWKVGCNGMAFKKDLYGHVFEENPYYYMYSDEYSERLILYYADTVVISDAQYIFWQLPTSITHKKSVKLYEILCVDRQLIDFAQKNYDEALVSEQFSATISHMVVLTKDLYRFANDYSEDEKQRIQKILDEVFNSLRRMTDVRKSFKEKMLLASPFAFRFFCRLKK
jgi:glycosyltransferase involved in cell wall biosynthesis